MIIQVGLLSFTLTSAVLVLMEMDGKTHVLHVLGFINISPPCAFVFIVTSCPYGLGLLEEVERRSLCNLGILLKVEGL